MRHTNALKKPAPETQDWHFADVLAALKKRGWSLRQVALEEGYTDGSTLGAAAREPYPKAEKIIARYIGVSHPSVIWPSRYDANGKPVRKRRPPMRGVRPLDKPTSPDGAGNPQARNAR